MCIGLLVLLMEVIEVVMVCLYIGRMNISTVIAFL